MIRYPSLFYGKAGLWTLRFAIPILMSTAGGYFFMHYRRAGNSNLGNAISNNKFVLAKNVLVRDFRVLNRRFTEDEKEQFLHNINLQRKGAKKYVYNPYLFATEAEYAEYYARMNSGKAILSPKSQREIFEENAEKIQKHEPVELEAANLTKDLSFSDRALGIKRLQLFKKEYIV